MPPRLHLHDLPGPKRAGRLSQVVEDLYSKGERVIVWVRDEGRRQILDGYLWTFRKLSFVPHCNWTPTLGTEVVEPVVLVGEPVNPNGATVLVVGDDLPPMDWVGTFEAVHDFIAPDEEGESRAAAWAEAGLIPS